MWYGILTFMKKNRKRLLLLSIVLVVLHIHESGIENFWSFTKRRLNQFSNGVKSNFLFHIKECELCYRKSKTQMVKEVIYLLKKFSLIY
jgi:transposase-like protein